MPNTQVCMFCRYRRTLRSAMAAAPCCAHADPWRSQKEPATVQDGIAGAASAPRIIARQAAASTRMGR